MEIIDNSASLPLGSRIDVVGNANNFPLMLVHGLRKIGYDAHLHLTMQGQLNAPENRYPYYAGNYPEWIHDWRHFKYSLWYDEDMTQTVLDACRSADVLVLNYDAVNLGVYAQKPFFCLLTGTDLLTHADPDSFLESIKLNPNPEQWDIINRSQARQAAEFCLRQREAIHMASGYSFFAYGLLPEAEKLLDGIGAKQEFRASLLMTEVDELTFEPRTRNTDAPLNIIMGSRLNWDKTSKPKLTDLDYKGNDIFIRAFARFIKAGHKATLTLFRKGMHIAQTESLINALGIADNINWHEECSQTDFLNAIRSSDIMADAIGEAHIGMVALDSMTIGRPVIASAPNYKPWGWDRPIPLCHSVNEEDVLNWLLKLAEDKNFYDKIALDARKFAEDNFSPEFAARKVLAKLSSGRPPDSEAKLFDILRQCRLQNKRDHNTFMNWQKNANALKTNS